MFGSMGQSAIKNLGNGGEMDGDVTITGDLEVQGGISLSVDEVIQGTSTIDVTNAEALLVRKNNDGGDVFIVDTTNSRVGISATPKVPLEVHDDEAEIAIFKRTTSAQSRIAIANSTKSAYLGLDGDEKFHIGFTQNLTNNTAFVIDDANNNIGIGTASPDALMHLKSTSSDSKIIIESSHASSSGSVDIRSASDRDSSVLFREGTTVKARIKNDASADALILTDGADNNTLFLYGQAVGIGTASPEEKIHSTGAIVSTGVNGTGATAGTERAFIDLVSNKARIGHFRGTTSAGSGGLQLYTDSVERMRIDASGNVNIGSTSSKTNNVGSSARGLTISNATTPVLSLWDTTNAGYHSHFYQVEGNSFIRSSGSLTIQTNAGTVALTLDSSQNATFAGNVIVGSGSGATAFSTADNLSIHGSGDSGISILSGSTSNSSLMFGDSEDNNVGQVDYDHANNTMSFITGASTALSINSSGLATFAGDVSVPANKKITIGGQIGIGALNVKMADGSNQKRTINIVNVDDQGWAFGTVTESNRVNFVLSSEYGDNSWSDVLKVYNADGKFEFLGGGGASFAGDVFIKNSGSNDPSTLSLWSTDTSIADDDNIGVILAQGSDSGGSPPYTGAKIEFNADATWDTGTSNYYATRIDFFTQSNNGTDTLANPALTIDSSQNATFAGDIVYSGTSNLLKTSTSDGSDNASITIDSSGGGLSRTRGAYIAVYGNEHSNGGIVDIQTGNDSGAKITLRTGDGGTRMIIDENSRISLSNNDSGTSNTVFGKLAGDDLASGGNYNSLFGENAGHAVTTGDYNVAIGINSLDGSTNAQRVTAIGTATMRGNATADAIGTVAVGYGALNVLTSGISNTAVGYLSLDACNTGSQNTAIGESALSGTDDGVSNTAVGNSAMGIGNAGSSNTAVGSQSMVDVTGSYNTAVGMQSLFDITSGGSNVAIGALSLKLANAGEDNNISIGVEAMRDVIENGNDASKNIAIGSLALTGGTLGADFTGNIAIGDRAMDATNTNGSVGQIAIGQNALSALTSGVGNTAVGFESLKTENDGSRNTAIGYKALTTLNTSAGNGETTAIGFEAGMDVSTGIANTFVGSRAGNQGTNDITTGSNNTMIGKEARGSANSASNQTVIGASATGVADNSVTLGNGDVTAVYMAQDSGASIFCGDILSGRASSGSTGNGHAIRSADSAIFSRDAGGETMQVCRNADNGQFIQFRANGSIVGDIKNTGGTVSLTGFSGCHESSSSDTLEVGMVVSTIDEEHSENHAKVEISNSVGDKRVYGVVSDLEGLDGSNVTIASVGISSIKVTGSCVGGDLLESNGDGTAKVQSDDIIRSKTLGKVTMGNSTEEVKMVSCVLYCG